MEITCKVQKRNLYIKIKGDIDHHTAEEIRTRADREMARENAKNIIFDFSEVSFMDSSGIGMVMGRYKAVAETGGKVAVMGISEPINRIFEISGLKKIIPCVKTQDEANNILGQ